MGSKIQTTEVSDEIREKVTAYVHKNYKSLDGKQLIIKEGDSCFYVYKHQHGGPMVLGKGIVA